MITKYSLQKLCHASARKFPEIKAIIQFGSSVSGDFHKDISDTDLAVIVGLKRIENKIFDFFFKYRPNFQLQLHIFSARSFIKRAKMAEPLILSVLHTGVPLYGKKYMIKLKNRNFRPNKSTARKCMLNSFVALGLAISDLTHGMQFDSVNSIYHAARSSIWAVLINQEVTPNNKRVFELIKDKNVSKLYKKIIFFRKNIPNYNIDFNLDKKVYKGGNINEFTNLLKDTIDLIKINYKKIFKKEFRGFFELLDLLNKEYKEIPKFYTVMLSVDWERETVSYHIMLSFKNKKREFIKVNANNGRIKNIQIVNK